MRHFAQLASAAQLPEPPLGADGLPLIEIDPRHAESHEELRARGAAPRVLNDGHHYA